MLFMVESWFLVRSPSDAGVKELAAKIGVHTITDITRFESADVDWFGPVALSLHHDVVRTLKCHWHVVPSLLAKHVLWRLAWP